MDGKRLVSDTAPPTSSSWYAAPKGDYGLYVQDGDFLRVNQQGYMCRYSKRPPAPGPSRRRLVFRIWRRRRRDLSIRHLWDAATADGSRMPFQFYPQPNPGRMLRSAAAALELPVPAVIDLWASVVGG